MRLEEQYKVIEFVDLGDERGNLVVIEGEGRDIPFDIKRVYYLYDVPGGESRGAHAHKDLYQLIVAANGSFTVTLDDEIQACVIDGLYFTEHELCEMLDEELSEKKPCNETIDKIIYCLENRIFFKTHIV